MANLITLFRLLQVFLIGAIALYASPVWQLINVPLIVINIILDGLDGIIARAKNEVSVFGAVFDIAADRIIESVLWIIWATLQLISIWIPIILISRGILIDSLRAPHAKLGKAPFSIMKTSLGSFLVASRTMRFTVGFLKLVTFSWLAFLLPAAKLWPHLIASSQESISLLSNCLVGATVTICMVRALPVILETILCRD